MLFLPLLFRLPDHAVLMKRNKFCEENVSGLWPDGCVVPSPPEDKPLALFERTIIQIGKLWRCYSMAALQEDTNRAIYHYNTKAKSNCYVDNVHDQLVAIGKSGN